jgi:sulfate adenylyltransferase
MTALGQPYGGELVSLLAEGDALAELEREAAHLPSITVDSRTRSDIELLANGGLSPLRGFMRESEYRSVVDTLHLTNGLPWSLPVTLSVDEARAPEFTTGARVALLDDDGSALGVITVEETYRRDKQHEATQVFRTDEDAHPGVHALYEAGDLVVAGPFEAIKLPPYARCNEYRLTPSETRAEFAERGWSTVVGFQTRNPIHRAHEYLIKCALESVDGALIHPLVGDTKSDDIPADVRIQCYETLIARYFVQEKVKLAVMPAAMRYAGPREAIWHAIIRKNYGCTHFIVGRDHAGVGGYYGTYDAQNIFKEIDLPKLGLQPLFFEHAFWCTRSGAMATTKTSPSSEDERIFLSGTKVREMLRRGEIPPVEFTRPEVAQVLIESMRVAV